MIIKNIEEEIIMMIINNNKKGLNNNHNWMKMENKNLKQ